MSNQKVNSKIKSLKNLLVWQKAHSLVLKIHNITENFPKKDQFILTSQMLRCTISISSNIAEGFSRKSKKRTRTILLFY